MNKYLPMTFSRVPTIPYRLITILLVCPTRMPLMATKIHSSSPKRTLSSLKVRRIFSLIYQLSYFMTSRQPHYKELFLVTKVCMHITYLNFPFCQFLLYVSQSAVFVCEMDADLLSSL